MIALRKFNTNGTTAFKELVATKDTHADTKAIIEDDALTEFVGEVMIEEAMQFKSRFELGTYLHQVLRQMNSEILLSPDYDGLWDWINALYFAQLAPKEVRRSEHYICTRKGTHGSLLHRNASRTAFELVHAHGANAKFCLQQGMDTHGQMLESLTASQSIARNRGFFAAIARMYLDQNGKVRRGAGNKLKKPKDRKPGETTGKGSIRRLPLALRRLDLTFDVEALSTEELIKRLPREFSRWTNTQ